MQRVEPPGNFWNDRFGGDDYFYGTTPNGFLMEAADRLAPRSRVLSLGEGEGRNAVYLAALGHDVVAVDGSEMGREKALKLAKERGVTLEYAVADLANWAPPGRFGGAVSIFCHLPRELRRAVYGRVWDALEPGGVFIVEAYRPEQLPLTTGGPKDEAMLVRLDDLRGDFPGGMERVGLERKRHVVEGKGHSGWAEVVDAVFEKPR